MRFLTFLPLAAFFLASGRAADTNTTATTNSTGTSSNVTSTETAEKEYYTNTNETEAIEFLAEYDRRARDVLNKEVIKEWISETNITDYNQDQLVKQKSITADFRKEMRERALRFNATNMDADTQRQLHKIKEIGRSAEPNKTKVEELSSIISEMESIYGTAKVCLSGNKCLLLDPDITRLMYTSRDYDELLAVWKGWRDLTGKKMRNLYTRYVELSNEAVQFLGYKDAGEEWRSGYESDMFIDDVQDMFDQVSPLYEQLHAYVRRRLKQVHGEDKFPATGHIPAHILGNMWAQQWENIIDILKPYKNKTAMDVTPEMVAQNYTVDKIFRTAEGFFTSLGFDEMVPSFWNLSMRERPNDGREVVCHASAWDFYTGDDFRIKMCTVITQQDLMTVHHEMGHIEYYMQYRNQPEIYRDGANDGFHEAVGDVMALSAQTPEHMLKIGLIKEIPQDEETDINFLMNMALQKVAFLPFGFLIDEWRWSVFSGKTKPSTYNADWWSLRCHLQGVSPPVQRTEEDFDPGAKYHVAADVPYLRYFISFIVQFQFHQAACQAAGHTGPLHRCDIYNNSAAGQKLRDMLKLGSSKPWPEAMKLLTGQEKMSAEPLMEYFKPLLKFLREENGQDYGWDPHCPTFEKQQPPVSACTTGAAAQKIQLSLFVLILCILFSRFL